MSIRVFKQGDKETLLGHLPIAVSYLLIYFLKAAFENKLIVIVTEKSNRED